MKACFHTSALSAARQMFTAYMMQMMSLAYSKQESQGFMNRSASVMVK